MPVACKEINGKWRLVGKDGKPEMNAGGNAADGGGHPDEQACLKQARGVNANSGLSFAFAGIPDLEGFQAAQGGDKHDFWKELIYVGQFESKGKSIDVDEALLLHWETTFAEMKQAGIDVPVPSEHSTDPDKRRATIVGMKRRKDSKGRLALFALHRFSSEYVSMAKTGTNVSVYSPAEFTDGKGKVWKRPIRHVALTDYPVVPDLDQFQVVVASLIGEIDMSLQALAKELKISGDDARDDTAIRQAVMKQMQSLNDKVASLQKQVDEAKKTAPAGDPAVKPEDEPKKIAAGLLKMGVENREMKIMSLVPAHMTPAAADILKKRWCSDNAVTLSLSEGAADDGFDSMIEAMKVNETNVPTAEMSSAQTLSNTKVDAEHNPLVADAERRKKEADEE
jgi:hypothetical protein